MIPHIKPKRTLPFKEDNKRNPPKKYKPNTVVETSTNYQHKTMSNNIPLSEKLRPKTLEDYVGHKQVIGSNTVLKQLLTKGRIPSMILWGPPGCGKSSLANVISRLSKEIYKEKVHIAKLSAVSSGVASIKEVVSTARSGSQLNRQTIVFMDEIHRFNKLQQDIFLPHVEAGTFTLIGTTTENPSYSLNSALLSRCRVFVLNKLTVPDIMEILSKAVLCINGKIPNSQEIKHESDVQNQINLTCKPDLVVNRTVLEWLAEVCDGDARVALNSLELAVKSKVSDSKFVTITLEDIKKSLIQAHTLCDRETKHSHHLYSAMHKSIKADNANASLYWLARIMAVKEDPVDIARRLVKIASEDIGLADPDALGIAVHTMHGCQMIGMPECDVLLGQCVVYLTKAPKSRMIINAFKSAENIIINHKGPQPNVPMHIKDRSGKAKLQANLGRFDNNFLQNKQEDKTNLPIGLENASFFLDDW